MSQASNRKYKPALARQVLKRSGIHIKESHKGQLHRDLKVPAGQKISLKKIEKAEHSSSPAVRKRAIFAENARHFKH